MSTYLSSKKIIKEWTDYNGHMNVAYINEQIQNGRTICKN